MTEYEAAELALAQAEAELQDGLTAIRTELNDIIEKLQEGIERLQTIRKQEQK